MDHSTKVGLTMVGQSDHWNKLEQTEARKLDWGWMVGLRTDHGTKVGLLDWGRTVGLRSDCWTEVGRLDWGRTVGLRSDGRTKVRRSDQGGGQKGQTGVGPSDRGQTGLIVRSAPRSLGVWGLWIGWPNCQSSRQSTDEELCLSTS